jgi:RNA polymerase sigma-70 factor (sigma-E family)
VLDVAEEFNVFVASRQRSLVRTAYLLTGNHHEAEDLVQATLTKTYLGWHRIRNMDAADAYVRRAMINEHTSWWRRAWRHRERSTSAVPEPLPVPSADVGEHEQMWQLICDLPPRQRAVIVLRYYEDLTPAEVAAALDCSVGTVASQTHRALATLRRRYAIPSEPRRAKAAGTARKEVR